MLPVYVPSPVLPPAATAGDAAPTPAASADARMVEAAVQFEGVFVAQMLRTMRQAAEALGGPGDDRQGALLDHALTLVAEDIARQRAFGIADLVLAQLATPPAGQDAAPNASGASA